MKLIIFFIAVTLTTMKATAQIRLKHQPANYEAAGWELRLLDKDREITIDPPPTLNASKAELKSVKDRSDHPDEARIARIKYWNAGAPSYRWNQIVLGLVDLKPEVMLRMPAAWMNLAIYDATILAWKEKIRYKRSRPQELDPSFKSRIPAPDTYSYPCEHSVTAAAAAYLLAYFFPEKQDSILGMAHAASASRIDAGVQFPSDVEAGWKLGKAVAERIIEQAKNDGSATKYKGEVNTDPKRWTGNFPMGISLAKFRPIVLRSPDQFRLPPPPNFENDMKLLKEFKRNNKSNYTALFWANNGPELWNELASEKMFESRLMDDAPAASRVYTVMTVAYHDAAIAIFDSKYTYWGIRPNQYDTSFKSLITTPPFPGYPSGHAAGAAVTCAIMEYFFPADAKQFQQMAQECADSRFYAGIHFRTDDEVGLKMGREMGKYIVETWMKGNGTDNSILNINKTK